MSHAQPYTPERVTSPGRLLWGLYGVIAAGALAVLLLWWQNTPVSSLANLGDQITAAGRITGLLGGYLLLVLVALMARIPWLENGIGTDKVTALHRAFGEYTIILLVAHTVLIIIGYAMGDKISLASETVRVIFDYPDVLMATVATLLLIGIGVISARALRPKFAYETWYYLHLYTYLAIALGFAHQITTGQDFIVNKKARILWELVHVSVLVLLVVFRILVPLRNGYRHAFRVAAVQRESKDVVSIYITGRDLDRLRAEAGQFFRWRFLARDMWWQSHPYSLSAAPDGRSLRITVKTLGDHTKSNQRIRPGIRVFAEGPYGAMTAARQTRRGVLLIAGGVGITPLRALFESLRGDLVLLYKVRTPRDFVFVDELKRIAGERGHRIIGVSGSKKPDPLSPDELRRLVPDVAARDVYLCGPPGMTDAASGSLRQLGVPKRRIHLERFDF